MQLPKLSGSCDQTRPFIFAAADAAYFDAHGKSLINSVIQHTDYNIHLHIYNPIQHQIDLCQSMPRVSVSWEVIDLEEFHDIATEWLNKQHFVNLRQHQMYNKGHQFGRTFLTDLIIKTYYASVRFIRLNELLTTGQRCLALDVDGLVRAPFSMVLPHDTTTNVYLYQKKSGEHLAGAILLNANSKPFLSAFANEITDCINNNDIYWFMDQLVLDHVVVNYTRQILPVSYIDWEMNSQSAIWSAKGKRKEYELFKAEQRKYIL